MSYNHSNETIGRLLDQLMKSVGNWAIGRVTHVIRWESDSGDIKLSLWGPKYRKSQEGVTYVDNAAQQRFWERVIGKPLRDLPIARNGSQQRVSDKVSGGHIRAVEEVEMSQPLKVYFSPQPESDGVSKGKPIEMIINKAGHMLWIPSGWDKSSPSVLGEPPQEAAQAQSTPPPHTANTAWDVGHAPPPPDESQQWEAMSVREPAPADSPETVGESLETVDIGSLADSLMVEGMGRAQVMYILKGLNLHLGWEPDTTKRAVLSWKSSYDEQVRAGEEKDAAVLTANADAQSVYDGSL